MASCSTCKFAFLVASMDDEYTFLNPYGDEVTRKHLTDILQCRAMPPIAGTWPNVDREDWCGYYA